MQITINGRQYAATPDQTILDVARLNDVYIPTLCYHEKVGASGRCRVCMVEIEGRPWSIYGLYHACTGWHYCYDEFPHVLESQRFVVDLILSSGNHDCLACEQNGKCELQDVAYYLGIERPSMKYAPIPPDPDETSAFILIDRTKCILCGRWCGSLSTWRCQSCIGIPAARA